MPILMRNKFIIRMVGSLWTSPNTLLGLLIGFTGLTAPRAEYGVINFYWHKGPVHSVVRRRGISAFTMGDCVIYLVPPTQNLRVHERRHVAQYHALGPLFLPAYFLLMAFFGYHDHPLETDAYEHEQSVCGFSGPTEIPR